VEISLDGPGEVHDEIRNIPRALEKTSRAILRARELQKLYHTKMRLNVICTGSCFLEIMPGKGLTKYLKFLLFHFDVGKDRG